MTFATVDHLRRARDDEQRVAILFQLGSLMSLEGVLDRKFVESEFRLEQAEEVDVRLQVPITEEAVMHSLAPSSAESRTQLGVLEQRFQCSAETLHIGWII